MQAFKVSEGPTRLQSSRHKKQWVTAVLLLLALVLFVACGGGEEDNAEGEEIAAVDPVIAEGQTVFKQNCASCHAVSGDTIIVGPSLAGIATRAATRVEGQEAQEYIQFSILRPGEFVVEGFSDLMPTNFGTTLTGEQLDAVIAYLLTLE